MWNNNGIVFLMRVSFIWFKHATFLHISCNIHFFLGYFAHGTISPTCMHVAHTHTHTCARTHFPFYFDKICFSVSEGFWLQLQELHKKLNNVERWTVAVLCILLWKEMGKIMCHPCDKRYLVRLGSRFPRPSPLSLTRLSRAFPLVFFLTKNLSNGNIYIYIYFFFFFRSICFFIPFLQALPLLSHLCVLNHISLKFQFTSLRAGAVSSDGNTTAEWRKRQTWPTFHWNHLKRSESYIHNFLSNLWRKSPTLE